MIYFILKKKNKMKINITTDNTLVIPEYVVDMKNKSNKTIQLLEHYEKLKNLDQQKKEGNIINIKDNKKFKKKSYRKKKYFKKAK